MSYITSINLKRDDDSPLSMLIHPEFDPAVIRIGSFAIHWYGLMYLLAFAQFLLLGRLRIRAPRYQSLGWSYKDL